jgi:lipid-binding SYLF domain-containing protein
MTKPISVLGLLATMAIAGLSLTAHAGSPALDARVAAANEVLQDFNRIPEQAIPSQLLNRAYAVAVIPSAVKVGFILGGTYGKGILVARKPDGRWSNPAFVQLANGGIGWQIGAQGSDLILVFKSRQSVENLARGKFTLGASASAAAGPVGRTAVAITDGEFKAEIYTYSRSRGLFAGVSLDGGALTMDHKANGLYYDGSASGVASRILADDGIPTPVGAQPFIETLTAMAPQLQWQNAGAAPMAPAAAPASDGTKTYAVDDASKAAPETMF